MATAKKYFREKTAYAGYQQAVEEEFGDTLWYFTTLCRRLGIGVDTILAEAANQGRILDIPASQVSTVGASPTLEKALLNLGGATSELLGITSLDEQACDLLRRFRIATCGRYRRPVRVFPRLSL